MGRGEFKGRNGKGDLKGHKAFVVVENSLLAASSGVACLISSSEYQILKFLAKNNERVRIFSGGGVQEEKEGQENRTHLERATGGLSGKD